MNEITERAQTILEASSRVWSSVVEENTIITSNVIEREYLRSLEGVFTANLVPVSYTHLTLPTTRHV